MKKRTIPLKYLMTSSMLLSAAVLLFAGNRMIGVSRYDVFSEKVPPAFDGYTILQLSDLHGASFGRDNARIASRINRLSPDLVVMTGDMVSSWDTDFRAFLDLSAAVAKRHETVYILGNHEQALGRTHRDALIGGLKLAGVRVLENEKAALEKGGAAVSLYGLHYHLMYYRDASGALGDEIRLKPSSVSGLLGESDPKRFNILLAHNPLYFPVYTEWGADLTLSGHVHGGIVRLPFLGGVLSPERTFFPEYDEGRYVLSDKTLIVSRGLGNSVGIRVFNPPELVLITLRRK